MQAIPMTPQGKAMLSDELHQLKTVEDQLLLPLFLKHDHTVI